MGWLNTEKPPSKYNASWVKLFVERLRTAVNFLDESNFPSGLNGSVLNPKSVPVSALGQVEWQIPIIALATVHSVNSTTPQNVGAFLHWSNIWGNNVKLAFEVTGGSSNSAATATFELHGAGGLLAKITTNTGQLEWLRSETFDPPTSSQTLLMKMYTSNSSYPANLLGSKLIIMVK